MVANLDRKGRLRLDRALQPVEARLINDPMLPPELQGMEPPEWWDDSGFAGTVHVPDAM